jgi:hypothetical protein
LLSDSHIIDLKRDLSFYTIKSIDLEKQFNLSSMESEDRLVYLCRLRDKLKEALDKIFDL